MGESQEWLFEPSFNRAVKISAGDARITSDAGLVLVREADHRLGLTELERYRKPDPCGKRVQRPFDLTCYRKSVPGF
jgi:hypothetical protein